MAALALPFLLPGPASANAGGPLLLIFNGMAFLYGSILIVLIEWGFYAWKARIPSKDALRDAFVVNLYSTVVVGLLFPLTIGTVSGVGMRLSGEAEAGHLFAAAGTWIYEGLKHPRLTFGFTLFWLAVTFVLTVFFEAWVAARRWRKRGVEPPVSARRLSWLCNSATYAGLFLVFLFGFGELFFS